MAMYNCPECGIPVNPPAHMLDNYSRLLSSDTYCPECYPAAKREYDEKCAEAKRKCENETEIIVKDCGSCGGRGKIHGHECQSCRGKGEIETKKYPRDAFGQTQMFGHENITMPIKGKIEE